MENSLAAAEQAERERFTELVDRWHNLPEGTKHWLVKLHENGRLVSRKSTSDPNEWPREDIADVVTLIKSVGGNALSASTTKEQ